MFFIWPKLSLILVILPLITSIYDYKLATLDGKDRLLLSAIFSIASDNDYAEFSCAEASIAINSALFLVLLFLVKGRRLPQLFTRLVSAIALLCLSSSLLFPFSFSSSVSFKPACPITSLFEIVSLISSACWTRIGTSVLPVGFSFLHRLLYFSLQESWLRFFLKLRQ